MRKMLFALAILVTGAFAFAAGSPASAMTANPVAGVSEAVQSSGTVEKVGYWGYRDRYYRRPYYRRHGYCYYYPWRCRGGSYYRYRRHHYRPWWW